MIIIEFTFYNLLFLITTLGASACYLYANLYSRSNLCVSVVHARFTIHSNLKCFARSRPCTAVLGCAVIPPLQQRRLQQQSPSGIFFAS